MAFLLAPLTVAFLQVELPVAFLLASLAVCLPSHNTQLEFVDTSIWGGHSGVQLCSHTTHLWNNMESLATCTLFPGTLAHSGAFVGQHHRHKADRLVSHAEPHLVQYLVHPLVLHVWLAGAGWCWLEAVLWPPKHHSLRVQPKAAAAVTCSQPHRFLFCAPLTQS